MIIDRDSTSVSLGFVIHAFKKNGDECFIRLTGHGPYDLLTKAEYMDTPFLYTQQQLWKYRERLLNNFGFDSGGVPEYPYDIERWESVEVFMNIKR